VIIALYPATTIVLARTLLDERLTRTQLIGLVVAAISLELLVTA
jgi:drug/metabolite transporter (DMT)-like permease